MFLLHKKKKKKLCGIIKIYLVFVIFVWILFPFFLGNLRFLPEIVIYFNNIKKYFGGIFRKYLYLLIIQILFSKVNSTYLDLLKYFLF